MPETKLTPERHQRIVTLLRAGNFRETAAAASGVTAMTLRRWLKLGAEGVEPYATFAADLEEAEAMSEARDVALVSKAAVDDWKAAAWRLERKSPSRWATRVRIEVDHQLNLFLDQLSASLPAEVFAQVAAVAALGASREESDGVGDEPAAAAPDCPVV